MGQEEEEERHYTEWERRRSTARPNAPILTPISDHGPITAGRVTESQADMAAVTAIVFVMNAMTVMIAVTDMTVTYFIRFMTAVAAMLVMTAAAAMLVMTAAAAIPVMTAVAVMLVMPVTAVMPCPCHYTCICFTFTISNCCKVRTIKANTSD